MVRFSASLNTNIATICFNYLQQQFYLVTPSMKTLAKGKKEEVILKLLKNLISATQGVSFVDYLNMQNFHESFLDDEGIKDIADVIRTEKPLFGEGEDPSMIDCGEPNQSDT